MGEMNVMDHTGHTKTVWDADKSEQVEVARSTFDTLKGKGYIAYKVKENGEAGEILHAFDPDLEKMILSPPIQGG